MTISEATTSRSVGFAIDPWGPGYSAALAVEALTELDATTAELNLDVETPADDWEPLVPDPTTTLPNALLVIDGVRRIDARVWVYEPNGAAPTPGIAASYAVGLVRCGLGHSNIAELVDVAVRRSLFSASPHAPAISTPDGDYSVRVATNSTPEALSLALQRQLTELEVTVATKYRDATEEAELLLVDGPLRGRTHLPNAVGYIKTHHTAYLSGANAAVVSALRPGQRTPIFLMGTSWSRHAWYIRLPSRSTVPWAGVARCEASAELRPEQVRALADVTISLLPSLAGVDYKDPRAPQNLIPIGGLEKLLRHRLGDARLLYRALRAAAVHAAAL